MPLNRNLGMYLDDDIYRNQKLNDGSTSSRRQTALYQGSSHYQTRSTTLASASMTNPNQHLKLNDQKASHEVSSTMTSNGDGGYAYYLRREEQNDYSLSAFCCNKLFWMFLLLLVPLILCGVNRMNEQEVNQINPKYLADKFYLDPNQESIYCVLNAMSNAGSYAAESFNLAHDILLNSTKYCVDCLRLFFWHYLPSVLEFGRNKTHAFKEKTTNYLHDLTDYKPATTGKLLLLFLKLFIF